MPGAIKRRKVAATTAKQATSAARPRGIDTFTRVSKATTTAKVVIEKNNYVDSIAATQLEEYSTIKGKRKVVIGEEENTTISSTIEERAFKPLPQRRSNDNPQTPQKLIPNVEPKSSESFTKSAKNLHDQFSISSNKSSSPLPIQPSSRLAEDLPVELLDLINLHAAFLTALSLHYAHNGTHSPADLRNLCPDVARAWGRRAVNLNDIRRSLGVLNAEISDDTNSDRICRLSLSDYGYGKICIEIKTGPVKAGRIARPINENLLNDIFTRGLQNTWEEKDASMSVKEFIEALPLEGITTCSSLTKMSPLLAKGQRRLEDLKAGITIKKESAKEEVAVPETAGKKQTLLERLRAKKLHQSTLPAVPCKAQLDRKAALQRIEEVASVLTVLSTSSSIGQQRISFTLPTILGKLRDSFKTPMSKEEGAICVRLLASDVAPQWVKIVQMGKVEALVVNRDERPSELDIKERVKRAA